MPPVDLYIFNAYHARENASRPQELTADSTHRHRAQVHRGTLASRWLSCYKRNKSRLYYRYTAVPTIVRYKCKEATCSQRGFFHADSPLLLL